MDVRGKTIVVTGAGRGIGRSIALHLARKGAALALLDTHAADLEETRAQCATTGATVRAYTGNVAEERSVTAVLDQVCADFGQLHGLVNNAGIVRDAMLVKVRDGKVVDRM